MTRGGSTLRPGTVLVGSVLVLLAWGGPVTAGSEDQTADPTDGTAEEATADGELVPLVPELAGRSFAIESGPRAYRNRLSFSPAYGTLGDNPIYTFRLAYNPSSWLGWEATIGHNPGEAVHALFHTLDALVRYPLPWRLQPYLTAGFGQALVFPGAIFKADPVTENALMLGGGVEFYIRSDVALRAEMRRATVLGSDPDTDDRVNYDYREATVGLSFYRTLGR
jgi:hypothetical protein